jgi:hypothetical protein
VFLLGVVQLAVRISSNGPHGVQNVATSIGLNQAAPFPAETRSGKLTGTWRETPFASRMLEAHHDAHRFHEYACLGGTRGIVGLSGSSSSGPEQDFQDMFITSISVEN